MDELELLVAAAQNGDVEAFGKLVIRFQDMVYARAYRWLRDRELAEEAAQDAFVEAFFSLPSLQNPPAFCRWLQVIVSRCCDRLSRGKQLRTVPLEEMASEAADPEKLLEMKQLQEWVQETVLRLGEEERLAVVLFYLGGYRQEEIAALLEEPVGRVKKRLYDARRQWKRSGTPCRKTRSGRRGCTPWEKILALAPRANP